MELAVDALAVGPLRLERMYGSYAGRIWPHVHLAVPSGRHEDEAFVVTSHAPTRIRGSLLWHRVDLALGAIRETHELGAEAQAAVDVRADGERVALVRQGGLRVRTNAGEFCWRSGGWMTARFSAGGTRVLAVSAEGHFAELDGGTGAELWRLKGGRPIAFSADRRLVCYRGDRDHVVLRDLAADREVGRWTTPPQHVVVLAGGDVIGLLANTLYRLTPGLRRPLWSIETGGAVGWAAEFVLDEGREALLVPTNEGLEERRVDDGALIRTHAFAAGSSRFSEDGRRAVRWSGSVYSDWSLSGGERWTGIGHEHPAAAVARSPDGALLATGPDDGTIRLWDADSGRERMVIHGPRGSGTLRFTPNGALVLLSGRYGGSQAWRVDDGEPARFPYPVASDALSWTVSADGRLLWTRTARESSLVRLADGEVLWRTGPEDTGDDGTIQVGPDGVTVVTVDHKFTYGKGTYPRILRLRVGSTCAAEPVALRGRTDLTPTRGVWVSDDGDFVAVRPWPVVVFDGRTGARLGILPGAPQALAFGGSRWLFAIDHDGRIGVYELPRLRLHGHVSLATLQDAPHAMTAPDEHTLLVTTRRGTLLRFAIAPVPPSS